MHLAPVYITTTRSKAKQAKPTKAKLAEWQAMWADSNKKRKRIGLPTVSFEQWVDELHGKVEPKAKSKKSLEFSVKVPIGRETVRHPSLDPSASVVCTKAPDKVYTGSEMIGISQMAKSNAVPVYRYEDVISIGKMRR